MTAERPAPTTAENTAETAADYPAPIRRGWWRHNGLALALLVLLVPATVFAMAGVELLDEAQRNPIPPLTAPKHPVSAFARRWELTASKEFVGTGTGDSGNGIPIGSSLIGVLVHVTPIAGETSPRSPVCSATLEAADPAGGELPRTWSILSEPGDYRYQALDSSTDYCKIDVAKPLVLELVYLVPTGTAAHADVEIRMDGGKSSDPTVRFLRFALE